MFDSLRKKLSGWFSTTEKEKSSEKKEKGKKAAKAKEKTPKKSKEKKPKKQEEKQAKVKQILPEPKLSSTDLEIVKEEEKEEKASAEESTIVAEEAIEIEKEEQKAEEIKEEKPKTGFFSKLISKFQGAKITQQHFDEIFMELELTLLENNVALEVVDKIRENLSKDLIGLEIKKTEIDTKILESLKSSILEVLIEPPNLLEQIKAKKEPYVILFFGINGTGKTTSIAKIANMLKKQNITCVLAAADTFRAASIEQLKMHADKVKVPIIAHDYGSDPASVAFDAIQYAKKNNIKVVLIDTAGRMYTKSNLLKEMEKIIRVSKPDLKIFVGESITGNDATDQAKTFNESAGIDGIILSKADIDDKAGTILSVSYVTQKPIYFLGTGQKYEDLQVFTKKAVLKNLGLD